MEEYPLKIDKSSTITDKKQLVKYVWAFTIGDGCLMLLKSINRPNKNINACFGCNQKAENEDYILWRAGILSNVTSVYSQLRNVKGGKLQIKTQTNRHPLFTKMRERIYLEGRKVIDPHYLKLLDWEVLAILYQDDGSLCKKPRGHNCYKLTLSTESFCYAEQVMLQRAIKDKTDILFSIQHIHTVGGLKYNLTLQKYDLIKQFTDGVKPFIKPSFEYKLLPNAQYPLYGRTLMDSDIV